MLYAKSELRMESGLSQANILFDSHLSISASRVYRDTSVACRRAIWSEQLYCKRSRQGLLLYSRGILHCNSYLRVFSQNIYFNPDSIGFSLVLLELHSHWDWHCWCIINATKIASSVCLLFLFVSQVSV